MEGLENRTVPSAPAAVDPALVAPADPGAAAAGPDRVESWITETRILLNPRTGEAVRADVTVHFELQRLTDPAGGFHLRLVQTWTGTGFGYDPRTNQPTGNLYTVHEVETDILNATEFAQYPDNHLNASTQVHHLRLVCTNDKSLSWVATDVARFTIVDGVVKAHVTHDAGGAVPPDAATLG